MKNQNLLPCLALLLSACATSQPMITDKTVTESRIEISYVLGHNNYKYIATAQGQSAEIASLNAEQVLEKKSIPIESYQQFAQKVEDLFKTVPTENNQNDCRTPYKIILIIKEKSHTRTGCRSTETDGQVGNIIKDGEFLFYSQK